VIVNICTLDRFKGKHQPSYLVSNLVGTISIVLEMKDTKTVTPQVRADITFPFYILLYLSFWTNVMHYVFTDLLDRSLCFKSGDHHILVLPLSPRSQAFQSLSQGPEQRYSSSLHKPNKGNIQKQPHLKNPGQRLIFPAILIAFCIMGALAGFLLPIMFFPAVGSVARLLRTDSRDDPVATKVPFFTCAF